MSAKQSAGTTDFADWRLRAMQRKVKEDKEDKEEWMQLCEQIASEQDTERVDALIRELNRMLGKL